MPTSRPAPLVSTADEHRPVDSDVVPEAKPPVKLLIYGASGAGKTALAGTAEDDPRMTPVLFVDLENGTRTIAWRTKAIRIVSAEDIEGDLEAVLDRIRAGRAIYKPTGEPYRTVVIDSITAGSTLIQDRMIHSSTRSRTAPNDTLEYGEWNAYTHKVFALIRGFRDAGVNLIMTAQETAEDRVIRLAVEGKRLREQLPQAFDIVGRLYIERIPAPSGIGVMLSRRILLQNDGESIAKSRGDSFELLPPTLSAPTIAKILDRDEEGMTLALAHAREQYGY